MDYFEPYDETDPVYIEVMKFRDDFLDSKGYSKSPKKLESLSYQSGEQMESEFAEYVWARADTKTVEDSKKDGCLWRNVLLKQ